MKNLCMLVVSLIVCITINVRAQGLKTESVSIFKNGQSFFMKSGKVKTKNGIYKLPESDIPASLFGSLWFYAPQTGIKYVKSYPDSIVEKKQMNAQMFHDLLAINKGRQVQVTLTDESSYSGVVEEVALTESNNNQYRYSSGLISMKSAGKWVTFNASTIKKIEFQDKPSLIREYTEKRATNIVEIGFSSQQQEQELDMMYLRNGLSWAPEYLLELQSKTKAKLTLQAEISNDGEDLEDVEMNLVVGMPNFRFADRLSFLINFLKEIMPFNNQQIAALSNSLSTQRITYGFDEALAAPVVEPNFEGAANEDFFFYSLDKFSLPKGGRAMQDIFTEDIEIAHIYECNLPTSNNNNNFQQDFSFSQDGQNKVYHTIRVNNSTSQPWTTGSVFIVNNQGEKRPLSQDMLTYTSSSGHSFIKLTESPDVKIKHAEKEVSRVERSKRFNKDSYWYDLVKVEGKIEVHNYKSEKIDLNIRRTILGELLETSTDWLTQGVVSYNYNPNKTTNVCWETKLDGGGELEIVYSYEMYVRS